MGTRETSPIKSLITESCGRVAAPGLGLMAHDVEKDDNTKSGSNFIVIASNDDLSLARQIIRLWLWLGWLKSMCFSFLWWWCNASNCAPMCNEQWCRQRFSRQNILHFHVDLFVQVGLATLEQQLHTALSLSRHHNMNCIIKMTSQHRPVIGTCLNPFHAGGWIWIFMCFVKFRNTYCAFIFDICLKSVCSIVCRRKVNFLHFTLNELWPTLSYQ